MKSSKGAEAVPLDEECNCIISLLNCTITNLMFIINFLSIGCHLDRKSFIFINHFPFNDYPYCIKNQSFCTANIIYFFKIPGAAYMFVFMSVFLKYKAY